MPLNPHLVAYAYQNLALIKQAIDTAAPTGAPAPLPPPAKMPTPGAAPAPQPAKPPIQPQDPNRFAGHGGAPIPKPGEDPVYDERAKQYQGQMDRWNKDMEAGGWRGPKPAPAPGPGGGDWDDITGGGMYDQMPGRGGRDPGIYPPSQRGGSRNMDPGFYPPGGGEAPRGSVWQQIEESMRGPGPGRNTMESRPGDPGWRGGPRNMPDMLDRSRGGRSQMMPDQLDRGPMGRGGPQNMLDMLNQGRMGMGSRGRAMSLAAQPAMQQQGADMDKLSVDQAFGQGGYGQGQGFGQTQGLHQAQMQQHVGNRGMAAPSSPLNKPRVINPAAPKAPPGGVNSGANPAAKATGQSPSGSGGGGLLSGEQLKGASASLNTSLVKMAWARLARERHYIQQL